MCEFANIISNFYLRLVFGVRHLLHWSSKSHFIVFHYVWNIFQLRQWNHHTVLRTLSSMFLINWILSLTWYQFSSTTKNTQIDKIIPSIPSPSTKQIVASNSLPPFLPFVSIHQSSPYPNLGSTQDGANRSHWSIQHLRKGLQLLESNREKWPQNFPT